jgi:hypothetical protein
MIIKILIRIMKRPEPEVTSVVVCAFEGREHNNNPEEIRK